MNSKLKVALIGYGYAGKTIHAPLILSIPGLALAAVVSGDAAKVRTDFPGLQVSPSLDELLSTTALDIIVIATPNHTHFELARRALLAGKHVVVDKPFTVTAAQSRELKKLAERNNLLLSVFHNRRWDADFLTLRELIKSEQLGELTSFESNFDRYRPDVRARWREQAGEGSGLWFDLGPHLLDQTLHLFGRPIAIQAEFAVQREKAQTVDYFHVLLRYPRLRVILHASLLQADETPRYVLKGELGSYSKFGSDTQEEALKRGERPGGAAWGYDPREGVLLNAQGSLVSGGRYMNLYGDYRQFYAKFRDAIRLHSANPVSLDDAILSMALLELALQSAECGSEMQLGLLTDTRPATYLPFPPQTAGN